MNNEQLKARASRIAEACKSALAWCAASDDDSIRLDKGLVRELRTSVVAAERLQHAAGAKMAVGVFGPSQAGKSYLISALARSDDGTLMSAFGSRQEDFIAKINPEGGKESTGLVTRFTYDPDAPQPPSQYPVQVGLLTEIDLVKILANSFVEDVQHPNEVEVEDHQAAVEEAIDAARPTGGATHGMAVEDVYDLESYVQSNLLKNTRMSALRRFGYWQAAVEVVPALSPEDRVKFFSTLWEELPSYTDIYRRLQAQLIKLEFARQIGCHPSALFTVENERWARSTRSIIDVATLSGLGEPSGDRVSVIKPNGGTVDIERAELAAMVAELVINLAHCPTPFFEHTDLLDFPGARSRQPQPRERLADREVRCENYIRGKVAYLFERYSADRELSAMLLCVGPSNQEVVGLGDLIERWIILTHGKTAQERSQVPCTLLFVLTKFDTAFEQGAGKSLDGTRWSTRLEASLLKPFGAHSHLTNWVSNWDQNGKFKNLFWLRNPNYRQDALFTYGGESYEREVGVRPDKESFIDGLRTTFLSNSLVHDHFFSPDQAWDGAMLLNDGGISRLITAIEPVCRPHVKLAQVAQQLSVLSKRVIELLSRHYISADLDQVHREKTELATRLLTTLGNVMVRGRLGELIASLKLSDDDAHEAYYQAERAATPSTKPTVLPASPQIQELDPALAELLGLAPVGAAPEVAEPARVERDFAQIFAENILNVWQASIATLSRDAGATGYHGVPSPCMVDIARELDVSARKHGIVQEMAQEVRRQRSFISDSRSGWRWKQIAPVTNRFNHFIDHAGNVVDVDAGLTIQMLNGQSKQIFTQPEPEDPMASLLESGSAYERGYLGDWLQGLQTAVRSNAQYLCGMSGDVEQNARLGKILEQLGMQD